MPSLRQMVMQTRPPRTWKLDLLFALLMVALVALCARMGLMLQDSRAIAMKMAEKQERMSVHVAARPGYLFVRASNAKMMVAGSTQVPSVFADCRVLRDDELGDVAVAVGAALHMDATAVQNIFFTRRDSQFTWIKRRITKAEEEAVRRINRPGIGITYEWKREYPEADMASTLIGWCRPDNTPGGGLEQSLHKWLQGRDGQRIMRTDAARRPTLVDDEHVPVNGNNVYLTIDENIQKVLEEQITLAVDKSKAKWGVGIVMNPRTGEIWGMTSVYLDPNTRRPIVFDPNSVNEPGRGGTPAEAKTNYCVTVPFEFGSAGKTLYAAAAVNAGVMSWETKLNCEGGVYHSARGGTISDHGSRYGVISLMDIICFSSNIGMGKVGMACGNTLLHRIAVEYGFGRKTGIEMPGESRGILRPLRQWDGYSTLRVPFGQEISATALQLATAYCALANGGELIKPRIIDYITDSNGKEIYRSKTEILRRVLRPDVAAMAVESMKGVVERKGGTGKNAWSENYTTFGKTGTAQIPSTTPGRPGYITGAFTGTFVGGAPANNPELVCLVSIHYPRVGSHYGGTVAAPFWKVIVEKTLEYRGVPHDRPEGSKWGDGSDSSSGHD